MSRRLGLAGLAALAVFVAVVVSAASGQSTSTQACYSAQFSGFVQKRQSLTDRVTGRVTFRLEYPDTLCTSTAPSKLSTCFRVAMVSGARVGRATRAKTHSWEVLADRPVAPTSVCYAGVRVRPGVVPPPPVGVNPLTCYPATRIGLARRARDTGIVVSDSFDPAGRSNDLPGGTRARLCVPAVRTGRPPAGYIACVSVVSSVRSTTVTIRTPFGLIRAAPGRRDELCADATLVS